MLAFLLKILLCLLIAAAIGFLMAWFLRGLALGRLREHNYRLTSDLSARDSQVAAGQTQIQDLRGKVAILERDLGSGNARIAELQNSVASEQRRALNVSDELRVEVEKNKALEQLATQRSQDLEAANQKLAEATRTKDAEIVRLGAQLTPLLALPAVVSARESDVRGLQTRLEESTQLCAQLQSEAAALKSSAEQDRRMHEEELARRATRAAELERALAADRSKVAELESQIAVRASEMAQLQSTIQTLESRITGMTAEKDSEIARLGAQLTPLVGLPALLGTRDSELQSLRQRLAATEDAAQKKQQDLAAVRAQLESEVAALRTRSDGELAALRARVGSLSGDVQSRESTLATLRVELDAARKTLDSRSGLLREAELERQNALDLVKVKDAEMARMRAEISTLGVMPARLSGLENELLTVRNERKDIEWQFQQQQSDLEAKLRECGEARRQLEAELESLRRATTAPPRQFMSAPAVLDDLKHIYGVGPVLEKLLNGLGVYQFRQVAKWNADDIRFFDAQLHDFHGRIERENWVRSAQEEHYKKYGEWLGDGSPGITMPETNR